MSTPVQRSASKPDQVQRGRTAQRDTERRRQDLWKKVLEGTLTAYEGREFIADVLLGDVGVFRAIDLALAIPELAARVARNNLGVKWVREDIARFPKLYRQLQEEHSDREAERTRVRESLHASPEESE